MFTLMCNFTVPLQAPWVDTKRLPELGLGEPAEDAVDCLAY